MSNLALRLFKNPQLKNYIAPTLMTSGGNLGENSSNSMNSTNIYIVLRGEVLYRHQGYEIELNNISGFVEPSCW